MQRFKRIGVGWEWIGGFNREEWGHEEDSLEVCSGCGFCEEEDAELEGSRGCEFSLFLVTVWPSCSIFPLRL